MMKAKVLFLGSGGSLGIPVIGCKCPVCQSPSPFNKRLRPSILIQVNEKNFLIDVGPDFREQALRYQIDELAGVLLTHTHYDHIAGIDELRIYYFRQKKSVPCLLSRETLEELKIRYHYFLPPHEKDAPHATKLAFQILENNTGRTVFERLKVDYFTYEQLGMKVNGFRLNTFAYITDIMDYDETIFQALKGVETLIISGRRWEKSKAHLSIPDAIAIAKKVEAKKTYFTHISHEMDHEEENQKLPEGMQLAYDGMELEIEVEFG